MMNFANDCSPYDFSLSINVIHTLEKQTTLLIEWYKCNYLKPNPDKWHFILNEREPTLYAHAGNKRIFNSNNEKVLGVYFDNKLNLEYHICKLCKKASKKLHVLARVSSFMSCRQKNAFITSQFGYCPFIWICHNRNIHRQINKIHEGHFALYMWITIRPSMSFLKHRDQLAYIIETYSNLPSKSIRP